MRILALFTFASFLVACGIPDKTASKTNLLNVGMTKAEVIGVMGQPLGTRAIQNTEILTYRWKPCGIGNIMVACDWVEILVRMVDGRLDAYGTIGDFNLSKNPTSDVNVTVK